MGLGGGSYPQEPDRPEMGGEDFDGYNEYRVLIETAIEQVEKFWQTLDSLPSHDVQIDFGSRQCDLHDQVIEFLTDALISIDSTNDDYRKKQEESW